ncbi:hypothetical protein GUI12_02500 [Anaplasmataceae bacterium AB001_6]|nr:hypothetical protein GUI12_02500 [Anaplasmataceae bacterium AB001_6]
MKIKNRLLRSLSLIAVISVVSLTSVSVTTASAASKKASSDSIQVGIFYSPSIINDKIDVTNPKEVSANDLTGTIDFKDHTKFAWLGGGAKVGYKMGDIVISAVTDYRKTNYYLDKDNVDIPYQIDGGNTPTLPAAEGIGAYLIDFKDVSKWYTGIDVDYIIAISKEMSVAVGAGAGMEYNTMNINYFKANDTGDDAVPAEAKLTALPFAMQGNASFGYEVMPGITPYVGYTLRYSFETDLKPKDDAVKLAGSFVGGKVISVDLPMKLKSSVDHIFKIGVNFTF